MTCCAKFLCAMLATLALCQPRVLPAGTVAYTSTSGEATGIWESRQNGEELFAGVPATLRLSYVYDPTIQGVTHNGVTMFYVPTLAISVVAPGYFAASASSFSSEVVWSGDAITFDATVVPVPGYPPSLTIDVSFTGSALTPGMLPSSLAGLEEISGTFSVNAQGGILSRETGSVGGSVVSAPEPSAIVLLAMGVVLCQDEGEPAMAEMDLIVLESPFDAHLHLRQGDLLRRLVPLSSAESRGSQTRSSISIMIN